MKAFYSQLEKANEKVDAKLARMAKVKQADLKIIRESEVLSPWDGWTIE